MVRQRTLVGLVAYIRMAGTSFLTKGFKPAEGTTSDFWEQKGASPFGGAFIIQVLSSGQGPHSPAGAAYFTGPSLGSGVSEGTSLQGKTHNRNTKVSNDQRLLL